MREEKNGSEQSFDPFESFRGMRDAYLDVLSKTMIEAVNTESYAEATGAMLDSYLTASAPVREALEKAMVQTLQQLSLPSRQEVAALAQRFTNLEMRLDDMDAKLDGIVKDLEEDRKIRAKHYSEDALAVAMGKALRDLALASRQEVADLSKSIKNVESRIEKMGKNEAAPHAASSGPGEDRTQSLATKLNADRAPAPAQPAAAAQRSDQAHLSPKKTIAPIRMTARKTSEGKNPR